MTQATSRPCDACGRAMTVTQGDSAWEFEAKCVCGNWISISWAHAKEPPTFERQTQGELF